MKHLFIAILGITIAYHQSSASPALPVSRVALQSFYNSYGAETKVSWSEFNGLYKASFIFNGKPLNVFYNSDGDQIATADYLKLSDLPKKMQVKLESKMKAARLLEIFEVSNDQNTSYYATIESEKETIVYKSVYGKWDIYKKVIK